MHFDTRLFLCELLRIKAIYILKKLSTDIIETGSSQITTHMKYSHIETVGKFSPVSRKRKSLTKITCVLSTPGMTIKVLLFLHDTPLTEHY